MYFVRKALPLSLIGYCKFSFDRVTLKNVLNLLQQSHVWKLKFGLRQILSLLNSGKGAFSFSLYMYAFNPKMFIELQKVIRLCFMIFLFLNSNVAQQDKWYSREKTKTMRQIYKLKINPTSRRFWCPCKSHAISIETWKSCWVFHYLNFSKFHDNLLVQLTLVVFISTSLLFLRTATATLQVLSVPFLLFLA